MIVDLEPYPQMMDSGVPWLGAIPEHWSQIKLKYLVGFTGGGTPSKSDESYWGGDIPWVSPKDMRRRRISDAEDHITESAIRESATNLISPGAVLIVVRSGILRRAIPVAVNDVEVTLNQDMRALRPRSGVQSEYLLALIRGNESALISEWTKQGATVESIEHELMANSIIPVPPQPEQAAIVRFLDYADRRIRRYIRAKQKLTKLLEEQKQAIIHRAVTRGLDPNIPLKPSGVEWLGDVPEHWEVRRVKTLFRLRTQKSGVAHGRELLSIYTHIGVRPRKDLEEKGNKASTTDDYWIVKTGDLIANKLLAWMGAIGVSHYDGVTSPAYDILMPTVDLASGYYHHLFRTKLYLQQFKQRSRGIMDMRLRLYFDEFGQIPAPMPPVEEQRAILKYYSDATSDASRTIDRTHREIELLREYRTRLISDVVTGKLDVRGVSVPSSDEPEQPESLDETDMFDNPEENDIDAAEELEY